MRLPALALAAACVLPAHAQTSPQSPRTAAASNAAATVRSEMDAVLFYQLLVGELELQGGRPAVAMEVLLDAARRSKRDELFERAVEVALQARAGDQALTVIKGWRSSMPTSSMAVRYQVQVLAALGRPAEAAEPVRTWLVRSDAGERVAILSSLPRLFVRGEVALTAAQMIEDAARTYISAAEASNTRDAALVATGRAWLLAGQTNKAWELAQRALSANSTSTGALFLALDLAQREKQAEAWVVRSLERDGVDPAVRLAYSRLLTQQQRLAEASTQLKRVTQEMPKEARPWLTLGAIELELKHPEEAELALNRYLALAVETPAADNDLDDDELRDSQVQARLMLAQAAEQRKDFAAAERQLSLITNPAHAADVQARRAAVLVRQGRWQQARELVRTMPAATPEQSRRRLMAELSVLRDARQWSEAYAVLDKAVQQSSADVDLAYEQAMMAEKLNRLDEMERLLRQVIQLKPDHQHAYNALGYSLADRGLRLDEARILIQKALDLSPGDPFITDSLAWVKFRQGQHQEALALLTQAYAARPDTEIAAHLGEVLWTLGRQEEAERVWSEGRKRDAENEVLLETLKRLRPGL
jgi:tetratricopeptide (TPR) repeat protein